MKSHVSKVVGSNPSTINWMDIFSHLIVVKIVMFFEKTNMNKKEARDGPYKRPTSLNFAKEKFR